MNTTTQTALVAAPVTVTAVAERVFFDRKNVPTLAGFEHGDKVAVWMDGDRKPWIGVVDGGVSRGSIMNVVGPRGGNRGFIRNIHSQFIYGLAGSRDIGLVAKIVKV